MPRAQQNRSLGLAPFSLTGANRVILTSLRGRPAQEQYSLVLLQQLSTSSKLGGRLIPVTSCHAANPHGGGGSREGRMPKGSMLKERGGVWAFEDQAGVKTKQASQELPEDILMCYNSLQLLAFFLKYNYSSSASL